MSASLTRWQFNVLKTCFYVPGQYLLRGIAERNSVEFSYKRSCKAHLASFQYNDAEVFLLKPKHFMNLNGKRYLISNEWELSLDVNRILNT